jgi:hypothetical protein
MKFTEIFADTCRLRPLLLGLAVAGLWSGSVAAFEIETGNEDLNIRWDNTIRYNAGWRMEDRNKTMADSWALQVGEYKFDKGDMVTNRFDLLSEFDFSYKKLYGFRVSVAGWNDFAYDNKARGNPAYRAALPVGEQNAYPKNKYTHNVDRYYTSSAEFLDAFVFFRAFEQENSHLDMKIGRHTTVWGESLFSVIHGVSYSQGPIDFRKGQATPGVEGKELFLPLNQISAHAQINDKVSVNAQYYLEWKPYRIYEGGTYFTYSDPFFQAGTNYYPVAGFGIPFIGDSEHGQYKHPDNRGNWGVNLKWASDFGTWGFYYRKFDDKVQGVVMNNDFQLTNVYADNVKLYGVSLSKQIAGIAFGAEIVRRENTALNTVFGNTGGIVRGDNGMARGDTWHALVNAMAFIGKTPLFDSATVLAELSYSRLDKAYKKTWASYSAVGSKYSCADLGGGGDKDDGCSTNDAWGLAVNFTPTWYQLFPSLDVSLPLHYDRGLKGNSPVPFGGNEGSGSWSIGLSADYKQQYKFDLAYTDYFGQMNSAANPYFGVVPGVGPLAFGSSNGGNAILKDRGWLSFTFKTSF